MAGNFGGAALLLGTFLHLYGREKVVEGIAVLLLFYGAFGLCGLMPMRLFGGEWGDLTEEDFAQYKDLYLADATDERDPYADLLASDLTGTTSPCYIAAARFDPLRDNPRMLAAVLTSTGGDAETEESPDIVHGLLYHSRMLDVTRDALTYALDFFRLRVGKITASTQQTVETTTEEQRWTSHSPRNNS